ncbi:hypothetical protein PCANC_03883 [Puccinia coronata f. sp. avenae]|uniref:Uncharacterized protein n=1 Tax=Puccinia coronata f. sp. avenae TaxID=200324 RepID=A0A2N5W1J1_9BASI|nr:hypothetical protein PCANC_03883 [Puccinia coronata f. sp. avenae]
MDDRQKNPPATSPTQSQKKFADPISIVSSPQQRATKKNQPAKSPVRGDWSARPTNEAQRVTAARPAQKAVAQRDYCCATAESSGSLLFP